jgi:predicted Zn-dependent protease with MMP-like domain
MKVTDQEFEALIVEAMDELADRYAKDMNNVAITWADEPTQEQRRQNNLREDQTLFGLYEGVPLPARGAGYNLVLPDKITIFKLPIESVSHDIDGLRAQVKETLWHEIAHHFGLGHDRIHYLSKKHFQ